MMEQFRLIEIITVETIGIMSNIDAHVILASTAMAILENISMKKTS
jgi:hypothetical protein